MDAALYLPSLGSTLRGWLCLYLHLRWSTNRAYEMNLKHESCDPFILAVSLLLHGDNLG